MHKLHVGDQKQLRDKGVCWHKRYSKWQADIAIKGDRHYLGSYTSEEEAALAYNTAAIERFGEFARLNIIHPR